MARRTLRRTLSDLLLGGMGLALIAIAFVLLLVREYPFEVIGVALAALWGRQYLKHQGQKQRATTWNAARVHASRQIQKHRSALISYYRQSITTDYFGNEDRRAGESRLDTFVNKQVVPSLNDELSQRDPSLAARIAAYVDGSVRELASDELMRDAPEPDLKSLNGSDYERYCAAILRAHGWVVQETPVTGDFGADLIAERAHIRLAVQCKLYSRPVGNKAVQEINSARPLYNATHACVVAPFGFTKQAKRTASGHGIQLLCHSGLGLFADELSDASGPRISDESVRNRLSL